MNKRFHLFSLLFIFSISISLISGLSSCKKSESGEDCSFGDTGRSILFNGTNESVAVAQLVTGTGLEGVNYTFQIAVTKASCNELHTINLNIEIPSGQKLNSTYNVVDFFDADLNEAYGSYTKQVNSPISQGSDEFASGKAIIADKGNKLYNFDLSLKTIVGENITLKGDVQF